MRAFFLSVAAWRRKKKDPYKTKKKKNWAGIIVFQGCDSEMLSIFLFFQGGDEMMLCTKEREVRIVTHTRTGAQACVGRVHMETHAHTHTQVHIYTTRMCQRRLMSCVLACMLTGISDGC